MHGDYQHKFPFDGFSFPKNFVVWRVTQYLSEECVSTKHFVLRTDLLQPVASCTGHILQTITARHKSTIIISKIFTVLTAFPRSMNLPKLNPR